jgi:hypothetical protein
MDISSRVFARTVDDASALAKAVVQALTLSKTRRDFIVILALAPKPMRQIHIMRIQSQAGQVYNYLVRTG